jgi:hypothetical protein
MRDKLDRGHDEIAEQLAKLVAHYFAPVTAL